MEHEHGERALALEFARARRGAERVRLADKVYP
jgi:hypothetical protein